MPHPEVEVKPVFAVIVASDSRFEELLRGGGYSDESGRLARDLLAEAGFDVMGPVLAPNSLDVIEGMISYMVGRELANAVVVVGGTGASPRDVSVEAVEDLSEKLLPGFGELFRSLTMQREGIKALYTRAAAGVYEGSVLFAIPGSPSAVELAIRELIIPGTRHILGEANR